MPRVTQPAARVNANKWFQPDSQEPLLLITVQTCRVRGLSLCDSSSIWSPRARHGKIQPHPPPSDQQLSSLCIGGVADVIPVVLLSPIPRNFDLHTSRCPIKSLLPHVSPHPHPAHKFPVVASCP